jgi:hypothetical protein
MRPLTAGFASALLLACVAAAPLRAAEPTEAETGKTSASSATLAKLLDDADLEYEKQDGDRLKLLSNFSDGRSHLVFLQPMTDIREVGAVEIYAPVMRLSGSPSAGLAKALLEANGTQKLGYFGIEEVEGKPWVFCYHNLPTQGLTSKSLAAVLITVAELADEMEKEQLGKDKDEF